jgi:hypothetical protein
MNINKLDLEKEKSVGVDRVNDIMEMQIKGSNLLPKPISYKDIDKEVQNFVSNRFHIAYNGNEIPTFFFTQQRMCEFTKTWEMVDDNKNIIPNFKTVSRETNPKPGTMMGDMVNIPGDPFFNIGTFDKWDGNKNITVSCKMKQPYCVDLMYNVKFISNSLNLLNDLNNIVVEAFKSKQAYIVVNGRYMAITLEDIGDDSDYDLDQRKIFVQNFELKVLAYIINENDIIFEENTTRVILDIEADNKKVRSISPITDNNVIVNFPLGGKRIINFKADRSFSVSSIAPENISSYQIIINGKLMKDTFTINEYDKILIKIYRIDRNKVSTITMN